MLDAIAGDIIGSVHGRDLIETRVCPPFAPRAALFHEALPGHA